MMGGLNDRGAYIEDRRNDRLRPLAIGGRYFAFLRWLPNAHRYLPVTADANSFIRDDGSGKLASEGDAALSKQLVVNSPEALASSLRRLKARR